VDEQLNPEEHPLRWNWKTEDGVQWVCKGYHGRSEDCEWEIASANLEKSGVLD